MMAAKSAGLARANMSKQYMKHLSQGENVISVLVCTIPCHNCQQKSLKVNPPIGSIEL
jgi:hypothetical protein